MFPATPKETVEEIKEWVERLDIEMAGWIIVVEGPKDEKALLNLGVRAPMMHINKGVPLMDLVDTIWKQFQKEGPAKGIIILTDWDRTGGRLARRLKESCLHLGIPFDLRARKDLAKLTSKWIKDVESLDTMVATLSRPQ
ncbi:MAG: toprim domain-containing protein [Thermoplasmatota archaeon]